MLTIPLQCFLNDKNVFHINSLAALHFPMETTSLVMSAIARNWSFFTIFKQTFRYILRYIPLELEAKIRNSHDGKRRIAAFVNNLSKKITRETFDTSKLLFVQYLRSLCPPIHTQSSVLIPLMKWLSHYARSHWSICVFRWEYVNMVATFQICAYF